MKSKYKITSILTLFFIIFTSTVSFANKTSVKIVAPEKAEAGTEVIIKIEVTHIGNSKAHYSDWVVVKVNGEEFKKWEYTKNNLPKSQNFTLKFKIKVETDLEIIAEGNCNKHGSKEEDKVSIKVEQ